MTALFRVPPEVQITWSGQSMLQFPPEPEDVSYMASSRLGVSWEDISRGGEGWGQLLDEHLDDLQNAARNIPGCIDILAMDGGQGDILNVYPDTPTAQEAYDIAVAYRDAALDAGFNYVGISTMPNLGPLFGRLTPDEQIVWDATNALIVANSAGFDVVVRCDTPPFVDATNPVYFGVDRTHLTQEGGLIKAIRWVEGLSQLPPLI